MAEPATTEGTVTYDVTSQWNTGYVVQAAFAPQSDVDDWRVAVELPGELKNVWNARIVGPSGDSIILESLSYNGELAAGQSASFGFQASGSPDGLDFFAGGTGGGDGEGADGGDDGGEGDDEGDSPAPVIVDAAGGTALEGDPGSGGGGDGGTASLMGALTTAGNQIFNAAGEAVTIRAVNWFGMETTRGLPDGLFARNYEAMIDQMQELGFNAIRIPFSLKSVLDPINPTNFNASLNPDLVGLDSLQILDEIVAYAESVGMGIVLDNHRSAPGDGPNPSGKIAEAGYTQADWIDAWEALATRYGDSDAIIGADLVNEPHGVTWGTWANAAERAGDAVLSIAPDWLIFVEGVGRYDGKSYWWGGNLRGVADRPVELALDDKLVYAPHDYPASVFPQSWFFDGSDLFEVFEANWGYIHEEAIAPIFLGEFGSRLATQVDRDWAEAITGYLGGDLDGDGSVDPGANPMSFAWWAWNPNSGDTGGILQDDWTSVRQNAVDLLAPLLEAPEGDGGGGGATANTIAFTISLDAAASAAVDVDYETRDGTAKAGTDYAAKSGSLRFSPGQTEKTVAVEILPDLIAEGEETFTLAITGPDGTAQATGTITDDDGSPPSDDPLTLDVTLVKAWGSGAKFTLEVTNESSSASDWSLELDVLADTNRFWGANVTDKTGPDYTLRNEGGPLEAGQTDTVTYIARGRGLDAEGWLAAADWELLAG